jgi:hypothetical protein
MNYQGNLDKMPVSIDADGLVQYSLVLGADTVPLNALIGQRIGLRFDGRINCVVCGKLTKKAFGQGFCFSCFQSSPENAECIIRPELCEAHLGRGRNPEWEQAKHNQPHVVYLALTSGIKVGVTRTDNIPGRWIDQGAWKVIRFAETPYRRLAGEIEVFLKDYLTDKTDWRKMLKDERDDQADLVHEKNRLLDQLPEDLGQYYAEDDSVLELRYPVAHYPVKVSSLTFDKEAHVEGKLVGIRGQYLIFEGGQVLNLRRHSGYWIGMEM